jgi:hypothetical protein
MEVSKTTIVLTILHPTDWSMPETIEEWLYEIDQGSAVGQETYNVTEPVPDNEIESELIALGNDGKFFTEDVV